MENAMKKLLIAAVAAPVLLGSLPKAAPAAEPGVLLAQYYPGDAQRDEEWEHHREREAERWDSFFHARMHEHRERDGYNWVNLPRPEKERVIRDEWERWGARRWGR
jgi:Ni/Co efflux regulator RcnB